MISDSPEEGIQFAHLLIPIESVTTLFLSSKKEVRLLRFRGDRIIENQPMPFSLAQLNCGISSPRKSSPLMLRCKAVSVNKTHFDITEQSVLAPLKVETLLLNLRGSAT